MMNDITTRLSSKERVKRLILEPLLGRGAPPRGWTEEAMMADYFSALSDFPDHVLEQAARQVRLEHVKPSWPFAGDYLKVCRKIHGTDQAPATRADEILERSSKAHEYVTRRMLADGAKIYTRAARCHALDLVRLWLFDRACTSIKAGEEPHVHAVDLETQISVWEATWAAVKPQEPESRPPGKSFGEQAKAIIEKATTIRELEP